VKDYQIAGPDWLNNELYTMTASMPPDTTPDDLLLMMQRLLPERFQLAFHREMREMPVYELVQLKTGAKLKAVELGKGSMSMRPGQLTATAVPIYNFTDIMSRYLNRPVLDKTGLAGRTTSLWNRPEGKTTDAAGDLPAGPSLFTAIQEQMGLKLESRKAPIEILAVDRVEKVPTGN
jgi:uncharacterized protein (TIGR03435 family)